MDVTKLTDIQIQTLTSCFSNIVAPERQALIESVLSQRTRHLTVVLENIYQAQNASAVIRSCECFGIQDLHIIENTYRFTTSRGVVLGAKKWINLYRYQQTQANTHAALTHLKQKGYRLVATTLRPGSKPLNTLDLKPKTALLFGTELSGLSETAHELADEMIHIPMQGFTQSLNISVSAAICLQHLTEKLRQSKIAWQLNAIEKQHLQLDWLIQSTQNGEKIAVDALKRLQEKERNKR